MVFSQVFGLPFCSSRNLFSMESSSKYITNYSPRDYGFHAQNWCILQDKRGILYVGNQGGLLEYDGVSWRSIPVPTPSVFSLAIDDAGTIYVGGRNEFGRLIPDERGSLKYESLRNYLNADDPKSSFDVWDIQPTQKGVYFRTTEFLFRWESKTGQINKIPSPYGSDPFGVSFVCAGELFIRQDKIGLMRMVNDSLQLVTGGEAFADKKIYMMVLYNNTGKKFLIGTWSKGLYTYDCNKNTIDPFETNVDDVLKEKRIFQERVDERIKDRCK